MSLTKKIKAMFPQKNDKKKEKIRKSLFLAALLVFAVSSVIVVLELVVYPSQQDNTVHSIQELYYEEASQQVSQPQTGTASSSQTIVPEPPKEPERDEQGRLLKFVKLQEINPDIKGWVRVPNTVIDYPVLQGSDDEYYLKHDYEKKWSKYGSVFVNATAKLDGTDRSSLLYGHSMQDGRMFAGLLKYDNLDFYKQNPVFTYDNIYEQSNWKIFAVFKANTYYNQGEPFIYTLTDYPDDNSFMEFVYQIRRRSIFNTGVDFKQDDQIVLLSTCSYEFDGFRTVVAARKIRDGEKQTVDTSKAVKNPSPLYPDIWYQKKGGSKPKAAATYAEALANDEIDWLAKE